MSSSESVQFRTRLNGAQCRSVQKAVLLKRLKDRNDIIYEWVFSARFGSLIDLEQEMVTYAHVTYTDPGDNVWVISVLSFGR